LKDANRSAEYIYDEMVRQFEYSNILEVDPIKGPITTLEMAIDFADENSIIRLQPGVYSCEKSITKPGITIEAKEKEGQTIIIGNTGPVINIKLDKGKVMTFKRIIFAHSGIKLTEKYKEAMMEVNYRPKMCVKGLAEFDLDRNMDTIVTVNSGGVIMRDCVLSSKSIPNHLK
jgi:F-box protein 11